MMRQETQKINKACLSVYGGLQLLSAEISRVHIMLSKKLQICKEYNELDDLLVGEDGGDGWGGVGGRERSNLIKTFCF